MTTLFWPSDVTTNGFVYGWAHSNTICVAGVLCADTVEDAEAILADALRNERMQAMSMTCGVPLVLAYCSSPSPSPCITPHTNSQICRLTQPYHFVYYRRHSASSRRFYTLSTEDAVILPQRDSETHVEEYFTHGFTRCRAATGRPCNVQALVNQWNSAWLLELAIQQSQSMRRKEPTPTSGCILDPFGLPSVLSILKRLLDNPWFMALVKLKELSFTVRQVETRFSVLHFLLTQHGAHPSEDKKLSSHRYNEYYNSLWIVLNDVIIGIAFRLFLYQNRVAINQAVMEGLDDILAMRMQSVLLWLDSWPAGLKLNTELSRFYSRAFIGLTAQWTKLLYKYLRFLPALNLTVEIASLVGMTVAISMLLDLVGLFTAHFHACYLISSVIYRHIFMLVGSLWNLFRGKRYNVLRNRTDPWDYEVDQLLLGTILFTLAAHLFPTVLVYYAVFVLVRLSLITLYASSETFLAFMNRFPLFALMLRIKDSHRLPGDAYLLVKRSADHCTVTLTSQPLSLAVIFGPYTELWRQLARHYHPIRLGKQVLQGQILGTFTHAPTHIPPQ